MTVATIARACVRFADWAGCPLSQESMGDPRSRGASEQSLDPAQLGTDCRFLRRPVAAATESRAWGREEPLERDDGARIAVGAPLDLGGDARNGVRVWCQAADRRNWHTANRDEAGGRSSEFE